MGAILARIVEAEDLQARRMCAAENMQREDLSAIEEVEAIAELVDAELIEDPEYAAFGDSAVERVKALLGRLDSVEASRREGNKPKEAGEKTFHKFVEGIKTLFSSLPRKKEWRSFYNHDLPLITEIDATLRDWAIANRLNKSQTKAFNTLKREAPELFEALANAVDDTGALSLNPEERRRMGIDPEVENIRDLSASDVHTIRLLVKMDDKLRALWLKRQEIAEIAKRDISKNPPTLYCQSYEAFLERIPNESQDLLFTDPPYSTDVEDIEAFARHWLPLALAKVKPEGWAFICIGAYPEEVWAYLSCLLQQKKFIVDAPLVRSFCSVNGLV